MTVWDKLLWFCIGFGSGLSLANIEAALRTLIKKRDDDGQV